MVAFSHMYVGKDIHSSMSAGRNQTLTPSSSHWKCPVHKGRRLKHVVGAHPSRGLDPYSPDVEGQL